MKSILTAGVIAALVVASTATAALVVTSANIKDGTIKMADISPAAKRALKGKRGPRGAQGAQGNQGPQGPQGAQGIQRLVTVEASGSVAPEQVKTVVANCPAGMVAVSGGYSYTADGSVFANHSVATGWWVSIDTSGGAFGGSITATVSCSPNISPVRSPFFDPARLVAERVAMRRAEH
jgi:hypothetical protein